MNGDHVAAAARGGSLGGFLSGKKVSDACRYTRGAAKHLSRDSARFVGGGQVVGRTPFPAGFRSVSLSDLRVKAFDRAPPHAFFDFNIPTGLRQTGLRRDVSVVCEGRDGVP